MKLVLGTMTFGEQVDLSSARSLIDQFAAPGNVEIDTAHQYCEGRTEELLGALLPPDTRKTFYIASKVNPWNDQGLQPVQVRKQLTESLQRLGTDSIDLLYLHSPDLDTPVEATLQSCFELHQEGRFKDFGLSNYASWQVAEVVETCRRNRWMEPTVYQGMYNALTRDVERELFPCLRNYGISFYAYNPLAGGLLTGKYQAIDDIPDDGRFALNDSYQARYWKRDYFDVLDRLQRTCRDRGLTPTQAALSWLVNHSLLDAARGDAIILGVSRLEHLWDNVYACQHATALDQGVIDVLDEGWELIKPNCFRYFRP